MERYAETMAGTKILLMETTRERDPQVFNISTAPDVTEQLNLAWETSKKSMPLGTISKVEETEDYGLTFSIGLKRKDKKIWAKILMMPQWKATEWIFPRKKKRRAKRRKRWMEQ